MGRDVVCAGASQVSAPGGRGSTAFVVYGRRAVGEALESSGVRVERVWIGDGVPKDIRKEFAERCRVAGGVEMVVVALQEMGRISGDPRNDQGIAASIVLEGVREVEMYCEEQTGRAASKPARLIALDGITNPQNVGMIARSALGAGMGAMVWPTVGSPWLSGLVVKASAGTVFRMPIVRCGRLVEGLWELKRAGFALVGLEMDARAEVLSAHEPRHRAVYVVGSEAEGLSDEVRDLMDGFVRIPMAAGVESLNAAVAASLVCFRVGEAGRADA